MKNEVKRVLMNELGLTREYVRGVIAEVVADTAQRQIEGSGYLKSLIEGVVRQELSKLLGQRDSYTKDDFLTQAVKGALKDEATRAVKERVRVEVVATEPLGSEPAVRGVVVERS